MTRLGTAFLWLLAAAVCAAQEPKAREAAPEEPPEEDEAFIEKQYAFNPLQAAKEFKIGEFYLKRGGWKAAAARFEEATRWNPGYADAWLKLGETLERMKSPDARKAYEKFLEMAPDDKRAASVRKKLARKS